MSQNSSYKKIANYVFNLADDTLRGSFKRHEYGDVIIPFTILRRLDAILEKDKENVVELYNKWKKKSKNYEEIILNKTKLKFFNYSNFSLEILENFEIPKVVEKLDRTDRLFGVISKFSSMDLSPNSLSNHEMGLLFEEVLRFTNELANETSGDHYTPRDIVELLVSLVFSTEKKNFSKSNKITSIYDPCCGTGGMLTVGKKWINENLSANSKIFMCGQELQPESYAICKADMLITGEDDRNIRGPKSTLSKDQFANEKFEYMITNPPFGEDWEEDKNSVLQESKKVNSRFPAGLPRVSDGSLLFLQHMISKMDEKNSRIGIILNNSPLNNGEAGQGETRIREWIIKKDLLETIIALPGDMFFNTPIHTFVWILTNNKKDKRKGKIQLINAEKYCGLLRKRLNNKRKEISEEQRLSILKIYNNFQENEFSKIFENEFFKYSEIHFHEKSLNNKKVSKLIKTTKNNKIKEIINTEIKKHNPNFELKKDYLKTGYEINFQEIFYKYKKYEKINQVDQKINLINKKIGEITQTNSKINFHNSNGSELKKTGIQWMSKIPSEWSIDKIRNIFSFSKEKIGEAKNQTVLSLTQKGLKIRDISKNEGQLPESFDKYAIVKKGDIVMNPMDLITGWVDKSNHDGIISPAYFILKPKKNFEKYVDIFLIQLQRFYLEKIFLPYGKGVSYDYRWTLQPEKMGNFELIYPPEDQIEKFLKNLNIVLENEKDLLKLYKELQDLTKSRIISIMSNSFNFD
jgi:type I restriction enzyme M protein